MPNEHETLGSLFTDIADAIRAKTGGSASITADNFPSEIASIPSGGGGFAYSIPITKGTVHIFNPTPIYITLEVN